jgi:hypothetical protein
VAADVKFQPGEVVLRRHFQRDLMSRVWVGRVAADDEHGLWMWVASGSAHRDLGAADGRHLRDITDFTQWRGTPKAFDERPWGGDVLMLHPHEGDYSAWLFFDAAGALERWYMNLERPVTRWRDATVGGVDTIDYDLDVIVAPDRTWQWKDEDEFADRLRFPEHYWVDDEIAVRAEGERLAKRAESGEFPFDGTMLDYRPDPTWTVPVEMPYGWDRPKAW